MEHSFTLTKFVKKYYLLSESDSGSLEHILEPNIANLVSLDFCMRKFCEASLKRGEESVQFRQRELFDEKTFSENGMLRFKRRSFISVNR